MRCHTHERKPLQQPEIIDPEGVELRLKQSIYYHCDFGEPCLKPLNRSDSEAVKKRLAELLSIIRDRMEFRAHHLIGRLFGIREKRLTAKGKAQLCFQDLIDRMLAHEIEADQPWRKIDAGNVWKAAELIKSGVRYAILHSKKKVAAKNVEATQPADGERSAATIPSASTSMHKSADTEVFPPPPSGLTIDLEALAQGAPPAHAPISGGRARKRRRINQEIDPPPL